MDNRWITELLAFSRKERSGIIGLLLLIFLLLLGGQLISFFIPKEDYNFSKWEGEINLYLKNKDAKPSYNKLLTPFPFDPNSADSLTLSKIGLPDKVIANWLRYLARGGRFYDKKGVEKIFGMTPDYFSQLDSFLIIPVKSFAPREENHRTSQDKFYTDNRRDSVSRVSRVKWEKRVQPIIELNSADSISLVQIKGIGAILASRIIRYRTILGGYYTVNQLREVYGLREENFVTISPFLVADPSLIKTLNLNFSTLDELGHHPYIGFRSGRKLLRLRDTRGNFSSPEDLVSVLNSDSLIRLTPYLKFSQE